jgi:hypothetical protein
MNFWFWVLGWFFERFVMNNRSADPISDAYDRYDNAKRFKRFEHERKGRFSARSKSDRQKFGW